MGSENESVDLIDKHLQGSPGYSQVQHLYIFFNDKRPLEKVSLRVEWVLSGDPELFSARLAFSG
jgi:hypothetical protein